MRRMARHRGNAELSSMEAKDYSQERVSLPSSSRQCAFSAIFAPFHAVAQAMSLL
jgi:hypothetical protein